MTMKAIHFHCVWVPPKKCFVITVTGVQDEPLVFDVQPQDLERATLEARSGYSGGSFSVRFGNWRLNMKNAGQDTFDGIVGYLEQVYRGWRGMEAEDGSHRHSNNN